MRLPQVDDRYQTVRESSALFIIQEKTKASILLVPSFSSLFHSCFNLVSVGVSNSLQPVKAAWLSAAPCRPSSRTTGGPEGVLGWIGRQRSALLNVKMSVRTVTAVQRCADGS